MAKRPPLRNLPKKAFPPKGTVRPSQPLYHFGVPISRRYALAYARHFHLTFDVEERDRAGFGGKEIVDIADIDEASLESQGDKNSLHLLAQMLMLDHLKDKLGGFYNLSLGRPFSPHWECMVSLWSNHDFNEVKDPRINMKKLAASLLDALSVIDGDDARFLWWFNWDNNVVRIYLCIPHL